MKSFEFLYKTKPYPHQEAALKQIFTLKGAALLMSPGTGKSKVAIDKGVNLFLQKEIDLMFIVAPNGVQVQWLKEQFPAHCGITYMAYLWEGLSTEKKKRELKQFIETDLGCLKVFFINVEAFSSNNHIPLFKTLLTRFKSYLVIDEASRIKNPDAARTQAFLYGLNSAEMGKFKTVKGIQRSAKYCDILTGSIVTRSPYDIFAPFNVLKFNYFNTSFYGFKAQYGLEVKETSFGNKAFMRPIQTHEIQIIRRYLAKGLSIAEISQKLNITESNVKYIADHKEITSPYKNLEELKKLIEPVSYICNLEDVYDIKEPIREKLIVTMNKEQERIYRETAKTMISTYQGQTLTVQQKIVLIMRLSQITSGFFPVPSGMYTNEERTETAGLIPIGNKIAKIEALSEELDEYSFKTPVIVFARFLADIDELFKFFHSKNKNLKVAAYYGKTSLTERESIRESFSQGGIDLLLANPALAGIGLNLQRSHTTFFYSNDYSFDKRKQAEGRTYRIGQTEAVLFKDIICKDTIDEKILQILNEKRSLHDYFQEHEISEFLK